MLVIKIRLILITSIAYSKCLNIYNPYLCVNIESIKNYL